MQVNVLAWLSCLGAAVLAAVAVFSRRWEFSRDPAQQNAQFRDLQRRFLFPYLSVLFAESFQAPYLYALFHSYHYVPAQIAVLYVAGLVANVFFSFYCVHLSARYGRRALSLLSLGIGSAACVLKFFPSFPLLAVGRIGDGLFAALVNAPFQHWYNHEHVLSYDFPAEWLSSTFAVVTLGAGFLAVAAGLVSQLVVAISRHVVIPYSMSIVGMAIGGFFIGSQWDENRPIDAALPFPTLIGKAFSILKGSPLALVLCLVSVCVDATVQMFVFVWSPVFIRSIAIEHHELSLGVIYGALVAAYLLGLVFFSSRLAHYLSNSRLLLLSVAGALASLVFVFSDFPALSSSWPSARFDRIFLAFLAFEFFVGVYNASMDALQAGLLPGPHRQALLALVRLPVALISSMAIVVLFPSGGGEHKLILCAIGLLAMGSTLSVVLDVALTQRHRRAEIARDLVILAPAAPAPSST